MLSLDAQKRMLAFSQRRKTLFAHARLDSLALTQARLIGSSLDNSLALVSELANTKTQLRFLCERERSQCHVSVLLGEMQRAVAV